MKKGFTLVEALIVVAILSVVLSAIFGIAYRAQVSFDEEKRFTETSQQARLALDEITRYIRQAGNNPKKTAFTAIECDGSSILVRSDITGSFPAAGGKTGDPDGQLISPMEEVRIAYASRQITIDDLHDPANRGLLADNISACSFQGLNSAGSPTSVPGEIVSVAVTLAAETPQRAGGRVNTVTYRSQVFIRSKTFDVFATP